MKLMVALIISFLAEYVKSGLPNESVLTAEFIFSQKLASVLFWFDQKGLSLSCKTYAMEKEMGC